MPQKLTTTSNESHALVTISIESEKPHSGEMPQVHFTSVHWHTGNVNGPRSRADASNSLTDRSHGQVDEPRGSADTSNTSNEAEMVVVSHRTSAGTYLSTADVKRAIDETDGIGSHTDTSSGHRNALIVETAALNMSNNAGTGGISNGDEPTTYLSAGGTKRAIDKTDGLGSQMDTSSRHSDVPSIGNNVNIAANTPETVSICPTELKLPDLPGRGTRWTLHESNSDGKPADTLIGCTDIQCVETDTKTATYAPQIIRMHPNNPKLPNSHW